MVSVHTCVCRITANLRDNAHTNTHIVTDEPIVEKMGINHLSGPKRYRLTKRPTIDEVQQKFSVAITVKGVFQPHGEASLRARSQQRD